MAEPPEGSQRKRERRPFVAGSWLGVGIALGVAVGISTDNLGLWIAIGLVIGLAAGLSAESLARKRRSEKHDRGDRES